MEVLNHGRAIGNLAEADPIVLIHLANAKPQTRPQLLPAVSCGSFRAARTNKTDLCSQTDCAGLLEHEAGYWDPETLFGDPSMVGTRTQQHSAGLRGTRKINPQTWRLKQSKDTKRTFPIPPDIRMRRTPWAISMGRAACCKRVFLGTEDRPPPGVTGPHLPVASPTRLGWFDPSETDSKFRRASPSMEQLTGFSSVEQDGFVVSKD